MIIRMADNRWSKWKEKLIENKTKICQPRKKTSETERPFQESACKSPKITNKPIKKLLMAN